jgi:hypothetical protein
VYDWPVVIPSRRRSIELGLGLLAVLAAAAGIFLALQQRDDLEAAEGLRLSPGETREARCDGASLGLARVNDRTVSLRCYGDAEGSPPAGAYVLESGQRSTARCDGTRLAAQRLNPRTYELSCRGGAGDEEATPTTTTAAPPDSAPGAPATYPA